MAQVLAVARSTVYRVAQRFREFGEWGLIDQREDNGKTKLDEQYRSTLDQVVRSCPEDLGSPGTAATGGGVDLVGLPGSTGQ